MAQKESFSKHGIDSHHQNGEQQLGNDQFSLETSDDFELEDSIFDKNDEQFEGCEHHVTKENICCGVDGNQRDHEQDGGKTSSK